MTDQPASEMPECRETFEAYYSAVYAPDNAPLHSEKGRYTWGATAQHWQAWQAAWSARPTFALPADLKCPICQAHCKIVHPENNGTCRYEGELSALPADRVELIAYQDREIADCERRIKMSANSASLADIHERNKAQLIILKSIRAALTNPAPSNVTLEAFDVEKLKILAHEGQRYYLLPVADLKALLGGGA